MILHHRNLFYVLSHRTSNRRVDEEEMGIHEKLSQVSHEAITMFPVTPAFSIVMIVLSAYLMEKRQPVSQAGRLLHMSDVTFQNIANWLKNTRNVSCKQHAKSRTTAPLPEGS